MTSYNDIGKQARDVLQKGYSDSKLRVGVSHFLPHDLVVGTSGFYDHFHKKSDAEIDVELKVNSKKDKLNLSVKRGFSLSNGASFSLAATGGDRWGIKNLGQSFNHKGKIDFSYKNQRFNGDVSIASLAGTGSHSVTPRFCLSYGPVALGLTSTLLVEDASCVATSFAAGYIDNNLCASLFVDDDVSRASCSLHGRVNPALELAARVGIDLERSAPSAEGGMRFKVDQGFTVSSKLLSTFFDHHHHHNDHHFDLRLAMNCCRDVTSGVKASASLVFDVGSLSLAKTKFGFGIDIEHDWLTGGSPKAISAPPPPPDASEVRESSASSSANEGVSVGSSDCRDVGASTRADKMPMRVAGVREVRAGYGDAGGAAYGRKM